MPQKHSPKRKYDSSRRQAQALDTQSQIIEAARELFIKSGYSGVSIETIARKAKVSPETIYSVFKNKRTILMRAMDLAVGTDGEPIPAMLRTYIQEVTLERNQYRQLQMFANRMRIFFLHIAPLVEVMRAAAKTEPEIRKLLNKYLDDRYQGMGFFIDCLLVNGSLRSGLSKLAAIETIWTLASAEVYNLLVQDRGWSGEEYEIWLSETLGRLLLPQAQIARDYHSSFNSKVSP
jgi:AcrR family transcriptional regulator